VTRPPKGDVGAYLQRVLQAGDVCLDGGANIGTMTLVAAERVGPTGRVYAIEPDARCKQALDGIAEQHGCVTVMQVALTETTGPAVLHLGTSSVHSSLLAAAVPDLKGPDQVHGVPLDAITDQPVACVKLDVQGGEYHVLLGASRLLATCPLWVCEVWPPMLEKIGVTSEQFYDRFAEAGLQLYWMTDPLTPIDRERFRDWWAWCDRFVNLVAQRG